MARRALRTDRSAPSSAGSTTGRWARKAAALTRWSVARWSVARTTSPSASAPSQVPGREPLEPRPQRGEGRPRLLRLQAADPVDRLGDAEPRLPPEQQLPSERRAPERPPRDDLAAHARRSSTASSADASTASGVPAASISRDPPRLRRGERVVGRTRAREEAVVGELEAVRRVAAHVPARRARGGVGAQQERAVGRQPAGGEGVDRRDGVGAELAAAALVGQRGVDEAVQQHPAPGGQQRRDALGDELGARRGVEQRLGPRVDLERGVLHERADPLGQRDAAGLAQQLDVASARAQRRRQGVGERRLARPVEALDRDEPSAHRT